MLKTNFSALKGLLWGLLLIGFCSGCDPDATYTTIYIVRHAEVDYSTGNTNPPLTPVGQDRADDLRDFFNGVELAAIYQTEKIRTRETAEPTATEKGIAVTEIPDGQNQQLVDDVLNNHAGEAVLIVNHSHNILNLIDRFSGEAPFANYPSDDYDKLFVLIHVRKEGVDDTASVFENKYGNLSP